MVKHLVKVLSIPNGESELNWMPEPTQKQPRCGDLGVSSQHSYHKMEGGYRMGRELQEGPASEITERLCFKHENQLFSTVCWSPIVCQTMFG